MSPFKNLLDQSEPQKYQRKAKENHFKFSQRSTETLRSAKTAAEQSQNLEEYEKLVS